MGYTPLAVQKIVPGAPVQIGFPPPRKAKVPGFCPKLITSFSSVLGVKKAMSINGLAATKV